jgi:hypothetical protein
LRSFLLVILFLVFAGVSLTLALTLIIPQIPAMLGVAPDESAGVWQGLGTIVLAVPLLFGSLYAGGLLWLLLACHLFKRDELEWFVNAGPSTRLEIWLVERFSRQ